MTDFSIRDLERLTGIKAHTIRVWEQRYKLLVPTRTKTKIRIYQVEDLKKLLYVSVLSKNGFRPSYLASLSEREIQGHYDHLPDDESRLERRTGALLVSLYRGAAHEVEAILNDCFLQWPVETVIGSVVYPFLRRAGLLHKRQLGLEEQLMIPTLRRKLYWAIERLHPSQSKGKEILLLLPPMSTNECQLLYLHFELRRKGFVVHCLSSQASFRVIEELFTRYPIGAVFAALSRKGMLPMETLVSTLSLRYPAIFFQFVSEEGKKKSGKPPVERHFVSIDEALLFLENAATFP